ncbi:hypothetical protein F2Q69_00046962 [Brassica cretica]|uniref:Uncharacterized protein n=1 Tax=Brassica cretica TaxID=69181 RepID=A0A8S9PWF5_BRACR|nr:hypothetical protein F2Q69_00046962 [Brassica cretica]
MDTVDEDPPSGSDEVRSGSKNRSKPKEVPGEGDLNTEEGMEKGELGTEKMTVTNADLNKDVTVLGATEMKGSAWSSPKAGRTQTPLRRQELEVQITASKYAILSLEDKEEGEIQDEEKINVEEDNIEENNVSDIREEDLLEDEILVQKEKSAGQKGVKRVQKARAQDVNPKSKSEWLRSSDLKFGCILETRGVIVGSGSKDRSKPKEVPGEEDLNMEEGMEQGELGTETMTVINADFNKDVTGLGGTEMKGSTWSSPKAGRTQTPLRRQKLEVQITASKYAILSLEDKEEGEIQDDETINVEEDNFEEDNVSDIREEDVLEDEILVRKEKSAGQKGSRELLGYFGRGIAEFT